MNPSNITLLIQLVAPVVVVSTVELALSYLDLTVHLVLIVVTLFLVIIANRLTVWTVFDSFTIVSLEILVLSLHHSPSISLVILKTSLVDLFLIIIISNFTLTMLHIVLKLSLINSVSHLQHSSSILFSIVIITLIVISISSCQSTSSMELIILDTTFIMSTSMQSDLTVLVLPDIVNIMSLIDIAISKYVPSSTLLLTHFESTIIVIPSVQFESSTAMKLSLEKLAIVVKSSTSTFNLLQMSSPMINSILEFAIVNSSIFGFNLPMTFQLVVPEVSLQSCSILSDESSLSTFVSVLNSSLVA